MENAISPCLWFDGKAQETSNYYCSIFKNSKIISDNPLVVIFELNSKKFMGLNGGPQFNFTEAVSFVIVSDTQVEIDYYWKKLVSNGGSEGRCGWLKDKYRVSWQVIPTILPHLMGDPDKSQAIMQAFMKMNKLNIEALINA